MRALLLSGLIMLSGCSYQAPEALIANSQGITVNYNDSYATQAKRMVKDHCAQYGKSARLITGHGEEDRAEIYECR